MPNLLWIAYHILFPEIAFHLKSDFSRKKNTLRKLGGFRKFQEESAILEKKNDLNLTGLFSLRHFFPQTSMFFRRIICGRFGDETNFCRWNAFPFWKASAATFEGWKASRGSRLFCLSSLPVFSRWASFEFELIDLLFFQLFLSEQQRFYRLRTLITQGVLGPWVSCFYFEREISFSLISEERLKLPSFNQIFHDQ